MFIEYHKVFTFSTLNFVQSHNSLLVHFTEKAIYPLTFQCSRSILDLLGSRRAAIFLRNSSKKSNPWRLSQPLWPSRVTSVRFYYLTSLINLSFCRIGTPAFLTKIESESRYFSETPIRKAFIPRKLTCTLVSPPVLTDYHIPARFSIDIFHESIVPVLCKTQKSTFPIDTIRIPDI